MMKIRRGDRQRETMIMTDNGKRIKSTIIKLKNEMVTKLMQVARGQRSSSIQTRKPLRRLRGRLWKK